MKFKTYLQSIDGVSIYPLISLVIFMTVFVLAIVYIYSIDKKKLDEEASSILKD